MTEGRAKSAQHISIPDVTASNGSSGHVAKPPAPEPEFDWLEDEDIVIPGQRAVAVYQNRRGDVVIRQEANDYDDEDAVVVIRQEHLPTIIARLKKEAGQ